MTSKSPFIAVLVFESKSDSANYKPLYREDTVLVYADSEEAARDIVLDRARAEEGSTTNAEGQTIALSLKHVVDVSPCLSDDLSRDADLYSRHFRDYASYVRAEPLLGGEQL
ncbi:DUF4288 domain-containing protein [Nocardia goodfellowii]